MCYFPPTSAPYSALHLTFVFMCVCVKRPLLEPVESLLQMLLLWDPAARGGGLDPETNKPNCYTVLQNILNMKVEYVIPHCI